MYTYMYYFYLGKKKSCILNEKCLICFLTSRAVKGSMLQHHRPLQPAFPLWHPPIPTQLVGSLLPTHCLSCSVSAMIFPLSAFSSLFHSSRTWPGQLSALQASQSHGPRSPGCFPFLFTPPPPPFSPDLLGPILFSPSSILLPLKMYGIFCLLLSPLCLFAYFSYIIACKSLSGLLHLPSDTCLSLSLWLQCPSLFPGDLHPRDPNPRCSSLLDLSLTNSQLLPAPLSLAYCSTMVPR